jgi:hypothetical protein
MYSRRGIFSVRMAAAVDVAIGMSVERRCLDGQGREMLVRREGRKGGGRPRLDL